MKDYEIIASQIQDVRFILEGTNFVLPKHSNILNVFEKLSKYVIKNFNLPMSHKDYILKSLGLDISIKIDSICEELQKKHQNISDYFEIKIPLRAIETYFNYGRPEIELKKLIVLKYLIAELKELIRVPQWV